MKNYSISKILIARQKKKWRLVVVTFGICISSFLIYNIIFFTSLIVFGLEIQKILKSASNFNILEYQIKPSYKLYYIKNYKSPGLRLKDVNFKFSSQKIHHEETIRIPELIITKNGNSNLFGITDLKIKIKELINQDLSNDIHFFTFNPDHDIQVTLNKKQNSYEIKTLKIYNLHLDIHNSRNKDGKVNIHKLFFNKNKYKGLLISKGDAILYDPTSLSYNLNLLDDKLIWDIDISNDLSPFKKINRIKFKNVNLILGDINFKMNGNSEWQKSKSVFLDLDVMFKNYKTFIKKTVNFLMFYEKSKTQFITHFYENTLYDIIKNLKKNESKITNSNSVYLEINKSPDSDITFVNRLNLDDIINFTLKDYYKTNNIKNN